VIAILRPEARHSWRNIAIALRTRSMSETAMFHQESETSRDLRLSSWDFPLYF